MSSTDILIPSDETIAAVMGSEETITEAPKPAVMVTPKGVVINDASELVDKTVFIKVTFGMLGNSRKVPGSQVLTTDANLDRVKVSKTLLDAPELEAIRKADNKLRAYLYNTCLPFDMGMMILPYGLIDTVDARLKEYTVEREALIEAFLKAYPALLQDASKALGSLYKETDYPSVAVVRSKFNFEYRLLSFSVPGKLKSISAAMFQQETEKAANQIQSAMEEITGLMRGELLKTVEHLQEVLTPGDDGKYKRLYSSSVTNIQEFLKDFELRNVVNDQQLAEVVAKARELVGGVTAEGLRGNDEFREKLRAGMDSIKGQLSGLVEEAGRKFKFDEEEETVLS